MSISIDVNDLTLGEVEFFEEESGLTLNDLQDGSMNSKAIIALVCVVERRKNPEYTMDDARKVKLSEFSVGADPTTGEDESAS